MALFNHFMMSFIFLILFSGAVLSFAWWFDEINPRGTPPQEGFLPNSSEPEPKPNNVPSGTMTLPPLPNQTQKQDVLPKTGEGPQPGLIRSDFYSGFWSTNSKLYSLHHTQSRENGNTYYDLVFTFNIYNQHVLFYDENSKTGWEDYLSTLTVRTSNGELALSYLNTITGIFYNKKHVLFSFYADTCVVAGVNQLNPQMKLRNCIVNLDSGKGYFKMYFDDLANSFNQ